MEPDFKCLYAINSVSFPILHNPNPISTLCTQRALGARHFALLALDVRRRGANSHGHGLEGALRAVVVVEAVQAVDVERDVGGLGEALEAVRHHLAAQLAEELALEAEVDDGVGAVRKIDDGAREGLVERRVGVSEAGDADGRAEGLLVGGAESDADVFGRVVIVNCYMSALESKKNVLSVAGRTVQVALAVDGETPAGVLGQGVQHVVEEADAGVDGDGLRLAALGGVLAVRLEQTGIRLGGERAAVNVEGHLDLGLVGVAGEGGPAGGGGGGHCEFGCGSRYLYAVSWC